ncbi:MAG: hypothetical protein ACXWV4_06020 [Flavitalea sp.]
MTASKSSPRKKKVKSKKIKKNKSFIKITTAILRVLKSFRTKRLHLSVDTGDFALNGILYSLYASPAFHKHVTVNFENRNYALLQISNTPLRMLLAYLNIHFLHYKS